MKDELEILSDILTEEAISMKINAIWRIVKIYRDEAGRRYWLIEDTSDSSTFSISDQVIFQIEGLKEEAIMHIWREL